MLHARAAGVTQAVSRGAGLVIEGNEAVHIAGVSAGELIKIPAPACGAMPGHLSLSRIRAVHRPVSCRKCLRMARSGQSPRIRPSTPEQPMLPGLGQVAV